MKTSDPVKLMRILFSLLLISLLASCDFLGKMDYSNLFNREGYNHSHKVIATLGIQAGSKVVDLGAGKGYFSFLMAEAVGSKGHVYAVEIDPKKIIALNKAIKERGFSNISVITGNINDPQLPVSNIDMVFLCDAYHHFFKRIAYFKNLQRYLNVNARVVVLDTKQRLAPKLLMPFGHWLKADQIQQEFKEANYDLISRYDFLPIHSFEVFQKTR